MAAPCGWFLYLRFSVRASSIGENRIWCTCDPVCRWICYNWHQSRQQGYVPWFFEMATGEKPFKRWSYNAPKRRVNFSPSLVFAAGMLDYKLFSFLLPQRYRSKKKYLLMVTCHLISTCRYIKEGSTVSVMGVVQRNDNVLMIVPPSEPISTGCQWAKCVLPTNLDGLVLRCEDTSNIDVIPV